MSLAWTTPDFSPRKNGISLESHDARVLPDYTIRSEQVPSRSETPEYPGMKGINAMKLFQAIESISWLI